MAPSLTFPETEGVQRISMGKHLSHGWRMAGFIASAFDSWGGLASWGCDETFAKHVFHLKVHYMDQNQPYDDWFSASG